jgi:ribonuclease D
LDQSHTAPAADWITCDEDLAAWLQPLAADDMLGLDTEFMRRNTFYPQLALLQLAHGDRFALVDPTTFDIGPTLRAALQGHRGDCVMHSPSEDLEALATVLPGGPTPLFDTQLAAAFVGLGLGISYRALVAEFTGVELDKGETRSDWLQRPLTDSQKAYATLDVVHLRVVYDALRERLAERGREAWLREDCERLQARAGRRDGDPQPQRDCRGASEWPREQQALLRRILLWRDRAARHYDVPRPWLLDDANAMSLAQEPPRSESALIEVTRGQRALRSARRRELLDLLQQPLTAGEIDDTAAIPPAPRREHRSLLNALKKEVNRIAEDLDLPAGLLCPRRLLEGLVVGGDWPEQLGGWREPFLREPLTALLD